LDALAATDLTTSMDESIAQRFQNRAQESADSGSTSIDL